MSGGVGTHGGTGGGARAGGEGPGGRGRPSRAAWVLLTVVGAAAIALLFLYLTHSTSPRERLEGMRHELHALRAAADSCRDAVGAEEARFRAFRSELDSLRDLVRDYEALDPRGVPADRHAAYLEIVAEYNRGVGRWEAVSEDLLANWRACRDLTELHNAVADSAGRLADSLGLRPVEAAPTGEPR